MAKAIAAVTRQKLDMNQQCLSEAVANLVGSFFQCMPGSGSLTRSAINQQAGAPHAVVGRGVGRRRRAGHDGVRPVRALHPALGAGRAPDAHRRPHGEPARAPLPRPGSRFDAAIVAATAIAAFAISIEFCVLIGVLMSFMLAVPRTGQMHLTEFVIGPDGVAHERLRTDRVCGCILIFGLEGEMYFGSAVSLEQHLDEIDERVEPWTQVVVLLRMKRARNPDAVGIALLARFVDRWRRVARR